MLYVECCMGGKLCVECHILCVDWVGLVQSVCYCFNDSKSFNFFFTWNTKNMVRGALLRRNSVLIILIVITISIKFFSLFPNAVERYYSDGFYLAISKSQRVVTGWLPFSVGDIIYFLAGLFLLIKTISFIKKIIRKQVSRSYLLYAGKKLSNWDVKNPIIN